MRLAEMQETLEITTRAADQGALDGRNDLPNSHATSATPSATELSIRNLAQDRLDVLGKEDKAKIDEERTGITSRIPTIPFVVKRSPREFQVKAEAIVQEAGDELASVYQKKLEEEKNYRLFKVYHGLQRDAAPARSLFEAWAYITMMLALDGCLNAFFFKDIGALGLADGFLIAAVIAACNIAIGFMIGWGPLRYFGHRFKLHLLWAIPVFALLVVAVGAFNWGVAHFRDLVQVNTEGGLRDVWSTLRDKPLGLLSFPSYLMGLVGIGIAVYAAARAYTMFDSYPWYGWFYKRMKGAETDFLTRVAPVKDKIQKESEGFVSAAARDYEKFTNAAHELLADYDKIIGRIDDYHASARTIEDACNAAIRTYQFSNEQVRTSPRPAYFGTPLLLQRREDLKDKTWIARERSAMQERVDRLRELQEELERKVPEIKLELLSERGMSNRMNSIITRARDQLKAAELIEATARMIPA